MRDMVAGIGGTLIFARDAAALAAWYGDVLGLDIDAHPEQGYFGHDFAIREADGARRTTRCAWAIFQRRGEAARDAGAITINYRVDDLNAMLARIRTRGVAIERTDDLAYGRFAWLADPEGNRIELFEDLLIGKGDEAAPDRA